MITWALDFRNSLSILHKRVISPFSTSDDNWPQQKLQKYMHWHNYRFRHWHWHCFKTVGLLAVKLFLVLSTLHCVKLFLIARLGNIFVILNGRIWKLSFRMHLSSCREKCSAYLSLHLDDNYMIFYKVEMFQFKAHFISWLFNMLFSLPIFLPTPTCELLKYDFSSLWVHALVIVPKRFIFLYKVILHGYSKKNSYNHIHIQGFNTRGSLC